VSALRRQPLRASLALGSAAVLGLALVSLVVPYRLLYQNEFELVKWNNTSCYITGEHAGDALLFCPDLQPVRNVVAPKTATERVNRRESIFTRFGPAAEP
jgi:hypothetical protein